MNILEVTEELVKKVKHLFGEIEHSIEKGFCKYEGLYHKIEFFHPKEETKISLIIYNKDNICIFTTKIGIQCFHGKSMERVENLLEELSQ